jgi:hypothetical protein
MPTEKFQKALTMLKDPSLGYDLRDEDWDTLGNIMLAYASKNELANKLKEIEIEFLLDKEETTQSVMNLFVPPSNQDLTRELQIQKNQPAMAWAKSQLEQIESISLKKSQHKDIREGEDN